MTIGFDRAREPVLSGMPEIIAGLAPAAAFIPRSMVMPMAAFGSWIKFMALLRPSAHRQNVGYVPPGNQRTGRSNPARSSQMRAEMSAAGGHAGSPRQQAVPHSSDQWRARRAAAILGGM